VKPYGGFVAMSEVKNNQEEERVKEEHDEVVNNAEEKRASKVQMRIQNWNPRQT
jgi:ArsR family metal-binding transcriptional regulator